MPISFSVAVHPSARLLAGTEIGVATSFFDHSFKLTAPSTFDGFAYQGPIPSGAFKLSFGFRFTNLKQINLEAANLFGDMHVSFAVFSWPRQLIGRKTLYFDGNIFHQKAAATQAGCIVTCLGDNEKSGDGNCCVECENDDAVVKICC